MSNKWPGFLVNTSTSFWPLRESLGLTSCQQFQCLTHLFMCFIRHEMLLFMCFSWPSGNVTQGWPDVELKDGKLTRIMGIIVKSPLHPVLYLVFFHSGVYIRRLAWRSVGATCATRPWSELPVSTLHKERRVPC